MLIAAFPAVLALVGLLVWALSANPKVSEAGKIAFAVGLLMVAWAMAGKGVRVG